MIHYKYDIVTMSEIENNGARDWFPKPVSFLCKKRS